MDAPIAEMFMPSSTKGFRIKDMAVRSMSRMLGGTRTIPITLILNEMKQKG